jgi:hypothetical protein
MHVIDGTVLVMLAAILIAFERTGLTTDGRRRRDLAARALHVTARQQRSDGNQWVTFGDMGP